MYTHTESERDLKRIDEKSKLLSSVFLISHPK